MKNIALSLILLSLMTLGIIAHAEDTRPVLVPVIAKLYNADCQACLDAMATELAKQAGVTELKATMDPPQVAATLDEAQFTASEFINKIIALEKYDARLLLYVDAAMCKGAAKMCTGCFTEIPARLKAITGVNDVTLDDTGRRVKVTFDADTKIKTTDLAAALAKSDYGFTVSFAEPKE
ncbi:MAG: heavy metal-associated domain-containing protein [bacterium]